MEKRGHTAANPTLPASVREGVVDTPIGSIHYVGGGSGSPLFLIHGGHGCWAHWYANLPALVQQHTVFALDMPGYGQSADIPADTRLDEMAHAVGAAIAVLRESLPAAMADLPVHLGAFSFGTLVATTLALQQPQLVRSLLLINPPGLGEVSPEVRTIQSRAADAARNHGLEAGLEISLRELMLCQVARADRHALDLLEYGVRNARFFSRTLSRSTSLMPMLQALQMAAHVVLGEQDPHQRHALETRRAQIEQALGASSVSVFSGAAHWLQYDQPERFNALALSVFERASRSQTS